MNISTINERIHYRSPYSKLILDLLGKLPNGSLTLTLPDGSVKRFGTESAVASLTIHSERFFDKVFLFGDIGFGEAYVEGYWSTTNISEVIRFFISNLKEIPGISGSKTRSALFNLFRSYNRFVHILRANSKAGSKKNIHFHYDLSNDFFKLFLDEGMTYSSAYFSDPTLTLEEAQTKKYERLWGKLNLQSSDEVLEIGCGWGSNAIGMAERFGCKVTAVTISEEQYELAFERVREKKLGHLVTILKCDYRDIRGCFDKIISIEMLEAVGHRYLEAYFNKITSVLKPSGVLALQVITCPDSRYEELRRGTDWIQKHIFPGTLLPSVGVINQAINGASDLTLVDLKDLGLDYAKTLNLWADRFNSKREEVMELGFDESFIRKWNYYLSYCEAAFDTRNINVMQMVYARPNNLTYK